jgi:hypothetical protein
MSDPIRSSVEQLIDRRWQWAMAVDGPSCAEVVAMLRDLSARLQAAEQAQAEAEKERDEISARYEAAVRVAAKFHNALVGQGNAGLLNHRLQAEAVSEFDALTLTERLPHDYADELTQALAERDEAVALLRNIAPVTTRVEDSYRAFAWLKAFDARRCPCHLGSVCDVACTHGRHHDGCPAESGTPARHPEGK